MNNFSSKQSQNLTDLSAMKPDRMSETRMWQQNQYMSDSGIHSLASSHTPSVVSKTVQKEKEDSDSGWKSDYEPIAINPTTDSAPMSIGSSQDGSFLPQIRTGSDQKENKLPELDTDEAINAIPDLVKLIKDEDDTIVLHQAAMMVFQLSKSEAIESLIESEDMIQVIISALNRSEDLETIRFLAGTLYNISQTQKGLRSIFLVNCISCLVRLLGSPVESVLFYSITTLHNLLLHQEGAKVQIRQSGCLSKMTSLLTKNNVKFLTICTDCLRILAYGNSESKLAILSSNGPGELVRILRSYSYEKLLWTTARLLKVLSVCKANKPAIIEAGGLEALSRHLHHNSQRLAINCLWTIRNISDTAANAKNINLQSLLLSLVQLLSAGGSNNQIYQGSSTESSVVACTAGIISNLTCNNCNNKYLVYRFGCIKGILIAMASGINREDILEPCVCALRHLTSRHEEEERARISIVREFNGLPLIARVLYFATAGICPELGLDRENDSTIPIPSWSLVKALVGLLRNLSINLDNHGALREHGLVTGLILLLYATLFTINKSSVSNGKLNLKIPPSSFTKKSITIQGVRLDEIIEGVCGALYMLMREPLNRVHLAIFKGPLQLNWPEDHYLSMNTSAIALFVHLLSSDQHENLQRAAAGVLVEASHDKTALDVIANLPGASSRLEQLVYSPNEAIATYSSAIVIRIQEEHGCNSLNNFYDTSATRFSLLDSNNLDTPPHTNYDSCLDFEMMTTNNVEDMDDELECPTGSLSAMLGPPPDQIHSMDTIQSSKNKTELISGYVNELSAMNDNSNQLHLTSSSTLISQSMSGYNTSTTDIYSSNPNMILNSSPQQAQPTQNQNDASNYWM